MGRSLVLYSTPHLRRRTIFFCLPSKRHVMPLLLQRWSSCTALHLLEHQVAHNSMLSSDSESSSGSASVSTMLRLSFKLLAAWLHFVCGEVSPRTEPKFLKPAARCSPPPRPRAEVAPLLRLVGCRDPHSSPVSPVDSTSVVSLLARPLAVLVFLSLLSFLSFLSSLLFLSFLFFLSEAELEDVDGGLLLSLFFLSLVDLLLLPLLSLVLELLLDVDLLRPVRPP